MQTFTCVGDSFLHLRQNNVNNRGPNLEVVFDLRQLASVLGVRGLGVGEDRGWECRLWGLVPTCAMGLWVNYLPFSGLRSSTCETQLLAILHLFTR